MCFMQFAQNVFTSVKLAKQVVTNLKNSKGEWIEIFAETVKTNREGNVEKVKLFIGPDQTPEQRATLFMCKKFADACTTLYPHLEVSFWKQKGIVQIAEDGKKVFLAKMLPTAAAVDRTMVMWDNKSVATYGIDKTQILEKFESLVMDPASATELCL